MEENKLDLISAFKFEKRLKTSVAVYLSIILLSIIGVLVKIEMAAELQQALIVILGLITIATIDAFRKALDSTRSSLVNQFSQIIVQEGGFYICGDYVGGTINQGSERKQTLAEAAVEIQQLLRQLEKSNPTATEAEKVAYVNDETPPALKSRVASAVKAGSISAVESLLDNIPLSNITKAIVEGWIYSADLIPFF
ncbi:hypothetical protein [Microcoleus asticus]|uniref:Uncharacterized protein n=1 Tax=Microcoleus asticus IPMA8 TaxID=2563858 RepID=A0ABX2CWE5_9CYAN|nr:hypothetical protein [Microcoleus asticus]NQE33770.1 hypothetical protein [Microcoleus asticus IPMA8]